MSKAGYCRAKLFGLVLAVSIVSLLALSPPALAAQGITGTVRDASSTAVLSGVVVSVFDQAAGDMYVGSDITNASGSYAVFLANGSYLVQFRDPAGRYSDQWWGTGGTPQPESTDAQIVTVSGGWQTVSPGLHRAASIRAVVRRAGHPLTLIPGQFVIVQYRGESLYERQLSGTTGSDGSAQFYCLPWVNAGFKTTAMDPTGRLHPTVTPAWVDLSIGTNVQYFDFAPTNASFEITPSVPSAGYSHKKNRTFTVTGTFSKSIANGSQIKILAVKGSSKKTFSGKIKSSKYSASLKLGTKGKWTLYALFTGNASLAANDSLQGKVVKIK